MPTTVQIVLAKTTLSVGESLQATARVTVDEADNLVDQRPITWASSNPAILTVSTTGLVKGIAAGTAQVRAAVDGVLTTLSVNVSLVTITLTAAQETQIMAVPIGGQFLLQGPTQNITCQVTG